MATWKDSFPLLASMLPTRMKSAYFPLILSCLGTILFQAAHFLYLRHVAKRPYLSFRPSRVYGDPLNDTEILVTRVLSAAPTLFTMLLAFNETGDASVEMKTAGNVVAGLVVFGILVSMKRYVHEHYSFDYNISHNPHISTSNFALLTGCSLALPTASATLGHHCSRTAILYQDQGPPQPQTKLRAKLLTR